MFGRNSLFQTSLKLSKVRLILTKNTIQLSSPLSEVDDDNLDSGGALVDASGRHDTSCMTDRFHLAVLVL